MREKTFRLGVERPSSVQVLNQMLKSQQTSGTHLHCVVAFEFALRFLYTCCDFWIFLLVFVLDPTFLAHRMI